MRFEGSFEYHTEIDEDLETEEIMIPSMLLQPFVENALWHGLMHKEGERRLIVRFEFLSDELYRCTIDDNGIGRKKAGELKAARSSGASHISRGMQITADRIALMQRRGQAASIQIIDKYDEAGTPAGTKVVIELSAYLTSYES
jgi:LytS/YehU family sensor histidine kinase